jgi:hypothetical protein
MEEVPIDGIRNVREGSTLIETGTDPERSLALAVSHVRGLRGSRA